MTASLIQCDVRSLSQFKSIRIDYEALQTTFPVVSTKAPSGTGVQEESMNYSSAMFSILWGCRPNLDPWHQNLSSDLESKLPGDQTFAYFFIFPILFPFFLRFFISRILFFQVSKK